MQGSYPPDAYKFSAPVPAGANYDAGKILVVGKATKLASVQVAPLVDDYDLLGVTSDYVDNTLGENGDVNAQYEGRGYRSFEFSQFTPALTAGSVTIGQTVYVVDGETLSTDSDTDTRVVFGQINSEKDGRVIVGFKGKGVI